MQPDSTQPSPNSAQIVTLSRAELDLLLEQAAARGAAHALTQRPDNLMSMSEAAAFLYGRPDRTEAFRALRFRYPEIDSQSVGEGHFRRFRRSALEEFLASKPQYAQRAKRHKQGGAPM
jgi:hypothetical protein